MGRVIGDLKRVLVVRRIAVILLPAAVMLVTGMVAAQEAPPALEFSFSNPGARSMALGGAFVALADDATAAFANPAGLIQLLRPEISLELRLRRYETSFTAGGRASGVPTGYGIDTVSGLRTGVSKESSSSVSFLSFVYPSRKWSLAVYGHQLADFAVRTELNGLFGDAVEGGTRREIDQITTTDLEIINNGIAGAVELSESLSLGFGVSYFVGSIDVSGLAYLMDRYPETFWQANSFLADRLFLNSQFVSESSDWGISAGFLWRFAEGWRFGGVYRQGPDFDYTIANRAGPAHWEPEGSDLGSLSGQKISIPDVWGLGVAYRSSSGAVTVGFEWDRVEYSVIMESLDSELIDTRFIALEDGNELRLGLEYVFLETTPLIAARVGLWRDPDHRFEYIGNDPFDRALYPPGENAVHLSVGAGIAFKRFQIDIGADFSDHADVFALSAIYSF
jgi:long-subunit fatty acid transport protein